MDAFAAIAEPNRRRILELLAAGERRAGEIAEALPKVTQPGVSRHLRVLREAGLVRVHRSAQRRIYALDPTGLLVVATWLSRYRSFWPERLERLESQLREG